MMFNARSVRMPCGLLFFAALWAVGLASPPASRADEVNADGQLENIVVTARKTTELVEEVPLAISVIDVADLQRRGQGGLKDISQQTPGFVFQEYSSSFDASPTLRGLTQFDVTSSVANVSTVVNGVYVPRNYSVDLGIVDISRVEVINGPQSSLYGGNAFAGVINYSLAPAPTKPQADISLTAGTAGRADTKVAVGDSFFNDVLALRANYASSRYDGTWGNHYPTPSGSPQDLGGHDNHTYGLAARFAPTKALDIEANYFHLDRREDLKPSYSVTGSDFENQFNCGTKLTFVCGNLSTSPNTYQSALSARPPGLVQPRQPGFTSSSDFIDTQVKLALTDEIHATYLLGYVRTLASEITSSSDDPVNGSVISYAALLSGGFAFGPYTNVQKEGGINQLNSHELRFDLEHDQLKALVGFYYSRDNDRYAFNIWQVDNGQGIDGDPRRPFDLTAFPFALVNHNLQTNTTAEFARVGYTFLDDRATVAAEFRHSADDLDFRDQIAQLTQRTTFETNTPRFTFDYKIAAHSLLYASAAKGVKEGGFNGTTGANGLFELLPSQQTFDPEKNWTYELGSKNTLFGGRAILNADVFLVKWSDLQIQEQPLNTPAALATATSVITTNLGAATSYGFESNGAFAVTHNLDLTYALSLIHPTFDNGTRSQRFAGYCDGSVCPVNDSVAGNTLPRTSKTQLAGGATWSDSLSDRVRWNAHGEFTYQSAQQVEEMNLAQIQSRLLANASLGLLGDHWDVTLWDKNIFDKKYVADSFFILAGAVGYGVSLGEKATAGITVEGHY